MEKWFLPAREKSKYLAQERRTLLPLGWERHWTERLGKQTPVRAFEDLCFQFPALHALPIVAFPASF